MIAVGLLAVVVQVLVAFTATLAAPTERGHAVGLVTSGVVIGILAARFVAGLLADLGGWRSVYLTSALLMLGMAVLLFRILPRHAPKTTPESYGALLRSMPALFLQEPILRVRAVLALLIFATFSTLWTAMVLPLSAPPLSLSHTQIGLFGLAGLSGALAASGAGRLADRGLGQWKLNTHQHHCGSGIEQEHSAQLTPPDGIAFLTTLLLATLMDTIYFSMSITLDIL